MKLLILEDKKYLIDLLNSIQKPETFITNDNNYLIWMNNMNDALILLDMNKVNTANDLNINIEDYNLKKIINNEVQYKILLFPEIPERIDKFFYNNGKIYILFSQIRKCLIIYDIICNNIDNIIYFNNINNDNIENIIYNKELYFKNIDGIEYIYFQCYTLYNLFIYRIDNICNVVSRNEIIQNNILLSRYINVKSVRITNSNYIEPCINILLYDLYIHNYFILDIEKTILRLIFINRSNKKVVKYTYNNIKNYELKNKQECYLNIIDINDFKIINIKNVLVSNNIICIVFNNYNLIIINKLNLKYNIIYLNINNLTLISNIENNIILSATNYYELYYKFHIYCSYYPSLLKKLSNSNILLLVNKYGFKTIYNKEYHETIYNQHKIFESDDKLIININNNFIILHNILQPIYKSNNNVFNEIINKKCKYNDKIKKFINNTDLFIDIKHIVFKYIYLYELI